MKAGMGATHFLTRTLTKVAAEMALSVLAYNQTRVMTIVSFKPLIPAIRAHNISPPQPSGRLDPRQRAITRPRLKPIIA